MLDLSADARAQLVQHLADLIRQTAALADSLGLDEAAAGLRGALADVPAAS